jgi:putative DNA primase/helicase
MARDENDMHRDGVDLLGLPVVEILPEPEQLGATPFRRCTDIGNAERLIAAHGQDLRWVAGWAQWIRWDDVERVWVVDDAQIARLWAQGVARGIRLEAQAAEVAASEEVDNDKRKILEQLAKKLHRWCEASEASPRIAAAMREAQCRPGVSIGVDELDADPHLFVASNAAIELRTGQIREARREDLVTRRSSVAHQFNATCPRWKAWLQWAMCGDEELVSYLQRAVGYSLTTERRERVFFFLFGAGANGKSTFLTVLRALLGSYAVQMPPRLLLEPKGGGERHPTELARLEGARAVIGSDQADGGARWNEALLKQLTGDSELSVRGMGQDFRDIAITWKLWIAANHLPYGSAGDPALWRRVHLVPFLAHIERSQEDPLLEDRLLGELPGILAWALEGLSAWRERGLGVPAAVSRAVADYRSTLDLVGQWLAECCVVDPTAVTPIADLWQSLDRWCKRHGNQRVMAANRLGAELGERGYEGVLTRRENVRCRRGIRLIEQASQQQASGDLWT